MVAYTTVSHETPYNISNLFGPRECSDFIFNSERIVPVIELLPLDAALLDEYFPLD